MNQVESPTTCKACGRAIIWMKTNTGATVPLDPKALIFKCQYNEELQAWIATPAKTIDGQTKMYTSHFATCPKVDVIHRMQSRKQYVKKSLKNRGITSDVTGVIGDEFDANREMGLEGDAPYGNK